MDTPSNINVSAVSEAALERAAQLAVANAVASAFAEDPVIGADLSRAISVLALQLPFCFEVRALSGRLVSSTPE
jgi:hypothetical protein